MNKNQKILRTIIILLAVLIFSLSNLYFLLIKFEGFWLALSGSLEILLFIGLLIAILLFIVRIIKYPQWRNKFNSITLGIALIFFCIYFLPFSLVNENTLQSPVKIRACYEGTMNTSILFFRENGKFEDFNIGFFAYVHTLAGSYTQKNDTLFLNFEKGVSHLLGDTLVIQDSILYKVQNDTLAFTYYYLGKCKGLN